MTDPVFGYVSLAALVVIMALGAGAKLRSFGQFKVTVVGYRVLPPFATTPFAAAFVGGELASCGLLIVPEVRAWGADCAVVVILVATLGMLVNLVKGRTDIDCGCGALSSGSNGGLSWWLVARNMGLMLLAVVVRVFSVSPRRDLTWSDGVTLVGATLALLVFYLTLTQLVKSHVHMRRNQA